MSDRSWGGFYLGSRSQTPIPTLNIQPHEWPTTPRETPRTRSDHGSMIPRPGPGLPGLNLAQDEDPNLPLNAKPAQLPTLPSSSSCHSPASRIALPKTGSILSLTSRPPIPAHSHFGTEDKSTLREGDRVGRAPSTEQMVEGLQVHMMNKTPRDPIAADYNAHVLHLLEHYHATQSELRRINEEVQAGKREKESRKAEFVAIYKEWLAREEQYGEEIKRLEHIIADKVPNGLANVALARSRSTIKRGGGVDQAGKQIRERIRMLLEDGSEDDSPTMLDPLTSGTGKHSVRYLVRLGDHELGGHDLANVAVNNASVISLDANTATKAAGDGSRLGREQQVRSRSVRTAEKPSGCHGPNIESNPRLVNPGHDFLISERLRHGLSVMSPRAGATLSPGIISKRPQHLDHEHTHTTKGTKSPNTMPQAAKGGKQPKISGTATFSSWPTSPRDQTPPSDSSRDDQRCIGIGLHRYRVLLGSGRDDGAGDEVVEDAFQNTEAKGDTGAAARDQPAVIKSALEIPVDMARSRDSSNFASHVQIRQQRLDDRQQKHVRGFSFALGDDKSFTTTGIEMSRRQIDGDIYNTGEQRAAVGRTEDEANGDIASSNESATSLVTVTRPTSLN